MAINYYYVKFTKHMYFELAVNFIDISFTLYK